MSGPAGGSGGYAGSAYGGGGPPRRTFEERAAAKEQMVQTLRDSSQQDRRVYVGNLAYDVKWHHLKDFMRQAGEVLFANVLILPDGMSKGCGIVEYATREQAQNAVQTLSNVNLMGRMVYVREDREIEPRFTGSGPGRGGFEGAGSHRGGYNGAGGGGSYAGSPGGGGRQLYVSNLPYNVGWQDLKDLFRQAAVVGTVVRADVHLGPEGRPKGSGIVAFDTAEDARNAIAQFNGYDWQGRNLEVREDRFASSGPPGFSRGAFAGRGGFGRGAFRGQSGGYGRGASYAGGGGGAPAGFDPAAVAAPPNPFTDHATSGGERSETIHVRNLPWSTSNEDLIELFGTIGTVVRAEIQYEANGRSKGTGVVQLDTAETAETAITKFSGYQYGGRPLGLTFVKYLSAESGEPMEETEAVPALTQDQIM